MSSVATLKSCFSRTAKKSRNKVGAMTQPCFTPLRMSKGSDVEPSKTTETPLVYAKGSNYAEPAWTSDLGQNLE